MVHGNQLDESKQIHLSCKALAGLIEFEISDEGCGFDPVDLPDPTSDDRIFVEGGRGVFLMKQLADEIQFCDEGRTVHLRWKI